MSRRLEDLAPGMQTRAISFLSACSGDFLSVLVTQTRRTLEEQADLYAQGRTKPGKVVTMAKDADSPHVHGLAFDIAFTTPDDGVTWDGPWERVGAIGESVGLEWGGRWDRADRPHFEMPDWRKHVGVDEETAARARGDVPNYPILRLGDKGENVKKLQRLLNQALALREDGQFGMKTALRLRYFQLEEGINATAETSPAVWQALEKAAPP